MLTTCGQYISKAWITHPPFTDFVIRPVSPLLITHKVFTPKIDFFQIHLFIYIPLHTIFFFYTIPPKSNIPSNFSSHRPIHIYPNVFILLFLLIKSQLPPSYDLWSSLLLTLHLPWEPAMKYDFLPQSILMPNHHTSTMLIRNNYCFILKLLVEFSFKEPTSKEEEVSSTYMSSTSTSTFRHG